MLWKYKGLTGNRPSLPSRYTLHWGYAFQHCARRGWAVCADVVGCHTRQCDGHSVGPGCQAPCDAQAIPLPIENPVWRSGHVYLFATVQSLVWGPEVLVRLVSLIHQSDQGIDTTPFHRNVWTETKTQLRVFKLLYHFFYGLISWEVNKRLWFWSPFFLVELLQSCFFLSSAFSYCCLTWGSHTVIETVWLLCSFLMSLLLTLQDNRADNIIISGWNAPKFSSQVLIM